MTAVFVALYRAMNLGHPNSPDRALLEQTLTGAGARSARSFQTNGTVVFEANNAGDAHRVAVQAAPRLRAACEYRDQVFVRHAPTPSWNGASLSRPPPAPPERSNG